MSRQRILLVAICCLVVYGIFFFGLRQGHLQSGPVIRPDAVLEFVRPDHSVAARLAVEIAETPEARVQGLMGRLLGDHMAGMLFLFERSEPQAFWMRNTPTSLDIIFVDDRALILNIAAYTTPMSDQIYASAGAAQYVVEARAGFADRFGIRPGYSIRWKRLR